MKKKVFILILVYWSNFCYAQKLYGIVNLTAPFSGISYTNGHNREEFRPTVARINVAWKFDLIYKQKLSKYSHVLTFEEIPFGMYFKLINKFNPPQDDTLLGIVFIKFGQFIDYYMLSYALRKEGKNEKGFLFKSRLRFNYSAGLGVSLNRSKDFYKEVFSQSSGGRSDPWTYMGYNAIHHRDGFGIFLKGTGGFYFINKKGKRKLSLNLFYNQGLKDMAHFDIHYQYGYWNDPSKQVDVPKQVLRSRGTTFGFSLGVPVTIKK